MCGASTSSLRGRAWITSSSALLQQCAGVRRWGLLAEPRSVGVTASSPTLQHVQAQGGGTYWQGPWELLSLQTAL